MSSRDAGVWIVVRGDYGVTTMCACLSEKAAKTIRDKYNADPETTEMARVELLPKATASVQKVETLSLSVTLWDDGEVTGERESTRQEWPFDMLYPSPHAAEWRWVRAPVHSNKGGRLDVFGVDQLAARRLFEAKRAEIETDPSLRYAGERSGHVDAGA